MARHYGFTIDMTYKQSFRARWILPITGPPIEDGIVTVRENAIVSVEPFRATPAGKLIDCGDAAIIPGLVNAHTHLEFSHLSHPLGQPGIEFTDWIRQVMQTRQAANASANSKADAIRKGLSESAVAGVACLGEIATAPIELATYNQDSPSDNSISKPHAIVFHEQLGRNENQFAERLAKIDSFLSDADRPASAANRLAAISPHAPYSVSPLLLKKLIELSVLRAVPVAMHVAETMAERELLEHQTGPFVDLLKDLGVWDAKTFQPIQTFSDILDTLAQAPRSMVIHGNFLYENELAIINQYRERMSLVYCPRTHLYFQHAKYPIKKILAAHINLAIGTDSQASNPDLNLFAEMVTIARQFPELDPLEILRLGTINGAIALGVDGHFGSVATNKKACLAIVRPGVGQNIDDANFGWLFDEGSVCEPLRL